jgi:predicted branched-subunit amino acid permease
VTRAARLLERPARRARFLAGFKAIAPALPGMFVWGVLTGVAMVKGGLSVAQALGMTFLILSGTTQLTVLPMLMAGVSLPIIALTAILTGLRFPVYAAALAPDFKHVPRRRRWLAGFLMTDPGSAVYLHRRAIERPFVNRLAFYAGVSYLVWPFWLGGSVVGVLLATWLPASSRLAYLGVLAVLALAAPMIKGAPAWAATGAAALLALLGRHWPWKLGLIAAVVAGVLAALLIEYWQVRRARKAPARATA